MQTEDTGPAARGVPECARCAVKDKACRSPEGQAPPFCPSILNPGPIAWAQEQYADPGVSAFARQASIQEGECYVGHDSLFLKYSDALCTVLVAKDRVLAHAPAAALHTAGSYYAWLREPR